MWNIELSLGELQNGNGNKMVKHKIKTLGETQNGTLIKHRMEQRIKSIEKIEYISKRNGTWNAATIEVRKWRLILFGIFKASCSSIYSKFIYDSS